jgi:hypothetical protein
MGEYNEALQQRQRTPMDDDQRVARAIALARRRARAGLIAGAFGCILGVLGILTSGLVFVPLATLCAVIGLVNGISRLNFAGVGLSALAAILSLIGFAASPSLWLISGGLFVASQTAGPTRAIGYQDEKVTVTRLAPTDYDADVPPVTSVTRELANTLTTARIAATLSLEDVRRNVGDLAAREQIPRLFKLKPRHDPPHLRP